MSSGKKREYGEVCANNREALIAEHKQEKLYRQRLRLQIKRGLSDILTQLRQERTGLLKRETDELKAKQSADNNNRDEAENAEQTARNLEKIRINARNITRLKEVISNDENFNQFTRNIANNGAQNYEEFQEYGAFLRIVAGIQRHKVLLGIKGGEAEAGNVDLETGGQPHNNRYPMWASNLAGAAPSSAGGEALDSEKDDNEGQMPLGVINTNL